MMVALVMSSAFFSASETAFFFLSREQIRRFGAGNRRQRIVAALMANPDVNDAEKFRKVTEAYQIELDYGHTIEAYEGLSGGMQRLLGELNAIHSYDGPTRPERNAIVHPVTRRHPESGRTGIYFNRMFVTRFEGMSQEESAPLISFLDQHLTRPEYTFRLSWQPGQTVLWDNRFTLHYPINDFTGHRRRLIRCTALVSQASEEPAASRGEACV